MNIFLIYVTLSVFFKCTRDTLNLFIYIYCLVGPFMLKGPLSMWFDWRHALCVCVHFWNANVA